MPSSTPSHHVALRTHRADVNDVFTFALRAGDLLLRNGASSEAVTKAVLTIADTQGYPGANANVTMGQLTLSYLPGGDVHPVTRVQDVGGAELDMRTLPATQQLIEDVVTGRVGVLEATELLGSLADDNKSPLRYRLLGTACMAAGFALLLRGDPLVTLVAALCSVVTELINTFAARWGLPAFYSRTLSSLTAVGAAALMVSITPAAQPGIIITAALVAQLAGSASVSAVQDLLTGWLLTACGRLIEASLLTAGLVVGTLAGLGAARRFGTVLGLGEVQPGQAGWGLTAVAAAVIALGFAVYCQTPARTLVPVAALGALGNVVFVLAQNAGVSIVTSTAVAAATLGVLSVALARPMGWPATGALDIAVIPLVPGMAFYRALTGFATHEKDAGQHLFEALALALSIGAGAVLGQFLATRVLWRAKEYQLRHGERRSGERLDRAQFAAQDVTTPDFRRPFVREDD